VGKFRASGKKSVVNFGEEWGDRVKIAPEKGVTRSAGVGLPEICKTPNEQNRENAFCKPGRGLGTPKKGAPAGGGA